MEIVTSRSLTQTRLDGYWQAYKDGKYSDLTIICQDPSQTFKVHKLVICTGSAVLLKMVESGFKEAITSFIALQEDDPVVISKMIEYLYKCDYSNPAAVSEETEAKGMGELKFHAQMYAVADKYSVPNLGSLAQERYKAKIAHCADKNQGLSEYLESIETVYESTPDSDRGLRDIAAAHMFQHGKQFESASAGGFKEKSREMMKAIPDFASDVLSLYWNKRPMPQVQPNRCCQCGSTTASAYYCQNCY